MSEGSNKIWDKTSRFLGFLSFLIPSNLITKYLDIENSYLLKLFIALLIFVIFTMRELNSKSGKIKKLQRKLEDQTLSYDELKKEYDNAEKNRRGLLAQNEKNKEEIKELKDNIRQLQLLYESYKNTYEKTIHDTATKIEQRIQNMLFLTKKN